MADPETDLGREIRDLAARRDINDAVQRYMRGLDRLDRDTLLSAFHPDAFVDCGLMAGNREDFADFAIDLLSDMEGTHHFLGQVRIEMKSATSASGECYFQAFHDVRDETGQIRDMIVAGRYVDEYSCENGQWRIMRRRLITDWVTDQPGSRAFFAENPAAPRGGRRGEDFSETRDWSVLSQQEEDQFS